MCNSPVCYAYNADLHCPECTEKAFGKDLTNARDKEGNGIHPVLECEEFDCPQHCAECDCFIRVGLTSEGKDYLYVSIVDFLHEIATGYDRGPVCEWIEAYDVTLKELVDHFKGK